MFKKLCKNLLELIKEEYKFIIFMIIFIIIMEFPLDYYIVLGGGVSDASKRIEVVDKHKSEGSLNISYVSQVDATLLFYGLSYIIPTWEREDANLYKYTEEENLEDIQFRGDLDLKAANGNATYWAYTLANKEVEETSSKMYVIITFQEDYPTDLKVGDEVLDIDGKRFETVSDYSEYIQTKEVGDSVSIRIKRKKKEQTITSKVYESKERKILGIGLQVVKDYKTNPEVKISFGKNESGPSGGLITTLEIYNQLTEKDITKGYTIAGTGTIEEDGTIGQIGGIEHKILGAATAKADIFLSPGGDNYKEAKAYIKKKKLKIKLIEVDTIEDAIKSLEGLD